MTEVVIVKNEIGAMYQDVVYDYWVTCKLTNNSELLLFDSKPIDVSHYLNQNVEIGIKALFIEKKYTEKLRSFYGQLENINGKYYFKNECLEIEISKEDIVNENLLLNTFDTFYFGRLDIESIKELNPNCP